MPSVEWHPLVWLLLAVGPSVVTSSTYVSGNPRTWWWSPLVSLPFVARYEIRPDSAKSECIGAFSFTKQPWRGGKQGEDALTWYAAPHRNDFAFRTRMFGGFPRHEYRNQQRIPTDTWSVVEVNVSASTAEYSVNGHLFATANVGAAGIPQQGYVGMIGYSTSYHFRALQVWDSQGTLISGTCPSAQPPAQLTVSMILNGAHHLGHCYYLANGKESCSAACERYGQGACSEAGLVAAASSVTACKAVVAKMGGLSYSRSGQYRDDDSGCTYGDWGRPSNRWVQVMKKSVTSQPTCGEVNADKKRMRVCACEGFTSLTGYESAETSAPPPTPTLSSTPTPTAIPESESSTPTPTAILESVYVVAAVELKGISSNDFTTELRLSFRETVAAKIGVDTSRVSITSASRRAVTVKFQVLSLSSNQADLDTITNSIIASVTDSTSSGFAASFASRASANGVPGIAVTTSIVEAPSTTRTTPAPSTAAPPSNTASSDENAVLILGLVAAVAVCTLCVIVLVIYVFSRDAGGHPRPPKPALPFAIAVSHPGGPTMAEKPQVETLGTPPPYSAAAIATGVVVARADEVPQAPPPAYVQSVSK